MADGLFYRDLTGFAAVVVAFIVVGALAQYLILGTTPGELLTQLIIFAAILAVGLLRVAVPRFRRAIDTGVRYYVWLTACLLLLLAPALATFLAAGWALGQAAEGPKIAVFVLLGLVWVGFAALVLPSRLRTRLLEFLRVFGWLVPLIFLIDFMIVSMLFFGFLAFYLFAADTLGEVTRDDFLNLFGYHLLDSIPALKIVDTLKLSEPLGDLRPAGLGAMLLVFKLAVLIPGIAALKAYWDLRHTGPADRAT